MLTPQASTPAPKALTSGPQLPDELAGQWVQPIDDLVDHLDGVVTGGDRRSVVLPGSRHLLEVLEMVLCADADAEQLDPVEQGPGAHWLVSAGCAIVSLMFGAS